MSKFAVLRWMLWREYRDQRQNRMLWPIYLLMPLIGAAVPVLLVASTATILSPALAQSDPQLGALIGFVRGFAQMNGINLEQAAAIMLLRMAAGYFLLSPLAIVSIAGAFAIVGEKQQRTLEPVLASPISTPHFLLGKILAVVIPAIVVTWAAACLGAAASVLTFYLMHQLVIWPDYVYFVSVFVLAPEIGVITALVCLRISVHMKDVLAATQMTALILIPAMLLMYAFIGPLMLMSPSTLLVSGLIGLVLCVALYLWVKRGFNREEILCRWQ